MKRKEAAMQNYFMIFILLAVLVESVADILFKYWSINAKSVLLWIGVTLYMVGTVLWAYSLKHEYISKAVSVFAVLNLMAVVLVGLFVFKEDVSLVNKIGIGLGIISVILLQW